MLTTADFHVDRRQKKLRNITQYYGLLAFQRHLDALDMRVRTLYFVYIKDRLESFNMTVSQWKSVKSSQSYSHFYTQRSIFQPNITQICPESIYCLDKRK